MELSVFLCIGAIFSGIVYLTGRKLAWKSLMRRENKTAALHYALKNHRKVPLRIIRRLLREGADVNHVGVFGEPPLVAALSRRQPLPVIRDMMGCPPRITYVLSPSDTRSMAPDTAATV